MARPRKPVPLIEGHRTKAEIAERIAREPDVPFVDVSPPGFLPGELEEEFCELSGKLVSIGIFTELDEVVLAQYLIAKAHYVKAVDDMDAAYEDGLDDKEKASIQTRLSKSIKDCRDLASDLGLTIASRCKIEIPKPVDDDGGYNL